MHTDVIDGQIGEGLHLEGDHTLVGMKDRERDRGGWCFGQHRDKGTRFEMLYDLEDRFEHNTFARNRPLRENVSIVGIHVTGDRDGNSPSVLLQRQAKLLIPRMDLKIIRICEDTAGSRLCLEWW